MTKAEMRKEIERLIDIAGDMKPEKVFAEHMKGASHILVYGAGNMGGIIHRCLRELLPDRRISCFLDRNAANKPEYLGCPVYTPDDARLSTEFRCDSIVVLALLITEDGGYESLEDDLRALGYTKFLNAFRQMGMALPYEESSLGDRDIFQRERDVILQAFDMLRDEHSQEVFLSVLKAHATLNYDLPVLSPGMTQYLDVDVPFRHNYRTFVDCGAFTGDTLAELVKRYTVDKYFGFEPDMQSYVKLSEQADAVRNQFGEAVLFPMGVGGKNEFLQFKAIGGGASQIDSTGETVIQVVRLDDVLKGYDNLLIKMDIEGAEIAALEGAKGIILDTKPDLAICVYHRISDLWRIPLMLKAWVPEYKFNLRNHFMGTYETVLYATLEGK
jgi:FkbM family methyltransferase